MESMAGSILRPLEDAAASLEARLANGEIVSDHGALRTLIRRLEGLARRARGAASQRHYLFDPNALPRDVRNQIIAFARVEAVLRMESCCKNSRDMMRLDDEPAWRRLFGLYFGPAPANTTHWRKLFRRTSVLRIEPGVRCLGVRLGRQMKEVVIRESEGETSGLIQVDERTAAALTDGSSLVPLSTSVAERTAESSTMVQLRYLNMGDIEGGMSGDDNDQHIVLHQTDYDTTPNGLICAAWSYTSESVLFDPRRPRLSRQGFRPGSPLRDLLNGYGLPLNLDSIDEIGTDMIGPTFGLIDLSKPRRKRIIPNVSFTLDFRMRDNLREPWYILVESSTSEESWEDLEPSLQRAMLDAPVGAVKNTQAETSDSEEEDSWTTASEEDCGSDGNEDDSSSYLDGSVEDGT